MLIVLGLVDVVMISNLLIMVIIGGYETFVSRMRLDGHPDQPEWLSHVNANVLKTKLAMSIIGISSIHLLRTFIESSVGHVTGETMMWQTLIHLAFVASALALAWIDRMSQAPGAPRTLTPHGARRGPGARATVTAPRPPRATEDARADDDAHLHDHPPLRPRRVRGAGRRQQPRAAAVRRVPHRARRPGRAARCARVAELRRAAARRTSSRCGSSTASGTGVRWSLAHALAALGLVLLAVLPLVLASPFVGLCVAVVVYGIGGGLLEVLVSPVVEHLPQP